VAIFQQVKVTLELVWIGPPVDQPFLHLHHHFSREELSYLYNSNNNSNNNNSNNVEEKQSKLATTERAGTQSNFNFSQTFVK
jgi:hypothetical protein